MAKSDVAYLVFDIETVIDGRLVQRIRYPDRPELTPAQAVAEQRAKLLAETGSDFIPATFALPISVAVAKVGADLGLVDVVTLDRPRFRPQVIARQFWQGWKRYGTPTLVSFNGRCFDLPVLELAAFRYGLGLGDWFHDEGPSYGHPRNRYNHRMHLDLQEVLTNFGTIRLNGGLDLLATLLGKPGKMAVKGHMVQELWEQGQGPLIDDYCMCDALDTYFVLLRTRVLQGRLTVERERELVLAARDLIASKAAERPTVAEYLRQFRLWQPVGDEDCPFVPAEDAPAAPSVPPQE